MLHDIVDDGHIQWHPPLIGHHTNFWPLLIWTLFPNLTFYLSVQGFHRTYATDVASQQRTLTPLDTWSCPTLGLAYVLVSRPISPELVLSPDFGISNIPRYFSFAYLWMSTVRTFRWYSRLERQSSKRGSSPAVGKTFHIVILPFFAWLTANTNEINYDIQLAYTMF